MYVSVMNNKLEIFQQICNHLPQIFEIVNKWSKYEESVLTHLQHIKMLELLVYVSLVSLVKIYNWLT